MRLLLVALFMGLGSISWGHQYHSEEVCHRQDKNLCVHMGYNEIPFVNDEFQFVVHVVAPAGTIAQLRGVKVDLWMDMGGHGHGSAPVKLQRLNKDHFQVTEAFFTMKGLWQIRVVAQVGTRNYDFIIPIEIKR